MHILIRPSIILLLVSFLQVATSLFYYKVSDMLYLSSTAFLIAFPAVLLFELILWGKNQPFYGKWNLDFTSLYWRGFLCVCIMTSILELLYFGIPLLGGTVYSEFGFPILHHFAVATWVGVFVRFKHPIINIMSKTFIFINPILISNRDVLLLTLFAFIVKKILSEKVSTLKLTVILLIPILLFGVLGQLRSSYAFGFIELPVRFNYESLGPILFWFFIYFTSSTFNLGYNMDAKSITLYDSHINVFPEYYKWYMYADVLGILFFITLILFMLWGSGKAAKYYKVFIMLYVFFFYEALMAVTFSSKVLVTHTLFFVLVVGVNWVLTILFPKKKKKIYD